MGEERRNDGAEPASRMPSGRGRRIAIGTGAAGIGVMVVAAWLSWPQIRFWARFEPLGRNAQGFPEYRPRQTGILFVRLPGGKFTMGAQKDGPGGQNHDPEALDNEGPVHEVTLSSSSGSTR